MQMTLAISIPEKVMESTETCWYCKEEKADDTRQNEESENPVSPERDDEDNIEENEEHNDSSRRKLGSDQNGTYLSRKLSSRVPKGHKLSAAGVAQGCAVYGPKDGISKQC
jgi:hypothetical protein